MTVLVGAFLLAMVLLAVILLSAGVAVLLMRLLPARADKRPRAWVWAERRGVTLTERSVPFVDTYLRNARALRFVCGGGALLLAVAWNYGTGVDLGGIAFGWVLGGYLAGCVWAELSLARVPASNTREASLVVRDPHRYVVRWLATAQIALPGALVMLALYAYLVAPAAEWESPGTLGLWSPGNVRVQTIVAGALGLVSLAVVTVAQQRIVRRPQPRSEADLVAADEAMRTSAVHMLGVTHLVLCLLLSTAGVLYLAHTHSDRANGPVAALIVMIVIAAALLWGLRLQVPGAVGGPVPPPPFPPEAAAAIDLTAPGGIAWTAPRRPDVVALVVVSALALSLLGLRWLGATNPDLSAHLYALPATTEAGLPVAGRARYQISLSNGSLLPLAIEALLVTPMATPGYVPAGPFGGEVPSEPAPAPIPMPGLVGLRVNGGDLDATAGWTATTLPGGRGMSVELVIESPPCAADAQVPTVVQVPPTSVRLRTAIGRILDVPINWNGPTEQTCRLTLPTGPQPDDPTAARAGVQFAYAAVYRLGEPGPGNNPYVDRPEGVDVAARQAREGSMGAYVGSTSAVITMMSFDAPDHAWVIYELRRDGVVLSTRRGEAGFVDGMWKVTRETVCADLALVSGHCP